MRSITKEDIETRALTADEKGWLIDRERQADVDRNEELFDADDEDDPELDADSDNYGSWKNKELLAEGARREPPVDFTEFEDKKSGYVAALRAWDVAHPEE